MDVSYFAAHKPALTEEPMKKRLRWAHEYANWTIEQWSSIIWSDESRFTVTGNDGSARIRKVSERYATKHIVPTKKYGGGGVMIWSCFHANDFGPLVLADDTVDQDKYINILAQSFHPWFAQLCQQEDRDFIFQEDGAICHTGGYARWWKETHQIRSFEHWALEKLIEEKRAAINNVNDLKMTLSGQWRNISVGLAHRLVASMSDRCQAVIDAKGGPTKY
ncbi:hypothetical protein G6F68_008551 [Rhizopus microsporus]|nr:hypothetical protein G6F69_008725 [Rhizopus microsporus]KAG1227053.1 hypothetical protein G6F67_008674 [Rhizopus microsporus]KAG1258793.1 hypothetical protein G6F68_008551 [Rhizopus microsporus]